MRNIIRSFDHYGWELYRDLKWTSPECKTAASSLRHCARCDRHQQLAEGVQQPCPVAMQHAELTARAGVTVTELHPSTLVLCTHLSELQPSFLSEILRTVVIISLIPPRPFHNNCSRCPPHPPLLEFLAVVFAHARGATRS